MKDYTYWRSVANPKELYRKSITTGAYQWAQDFDESLGIEKVTWEDVTDANSIAALEKSMGVIGKFPSYDIPITKPATDNVESEEVRKTLPKRKTLIGFNVPVTLGGRTLPDILGFEKGTNWTYNPETGKTYVNIPGYEEKKITPAAGYKLGEEEEEEEETSGSLDKMYKRGKMLLGAQIPLQFRSLFQAAPVVPEIPYAVTRPATTVSAVTPTMSELNRQLGTAYSIGASMGKYGPTGLYTMPGYVAGILAEGSTRAAEISAAETERLNKQELENITAANTTATAKATADLQRMQLQLAANEAIQTQRAQSLANITEVLTRMADWESGYQESIMKKKYYDAYIKSLLTSQLIP